MVLLVIMILGAAVCAMVASGKGRSAVGWGALGALFPVIAIFAICCIAPAKTLEAPFEQLR